ncbi:MAG: DUF1311 domain-containing protein [Hyphomonadaceae bacterium]|nr:DUF1311 domain-containing protein [Hyphomonadaceae bacterium]
MSPLIAFVLAIACAAPAEVHTDSLDPSPSLEACLNSASVQDRDPSSCIGVVSRRCFQEPGTETTVGSRECFTVERRQWEALAESYVQRLKRNASPTASAALDAYVVAQAEWRAARCGYARTIYEGGSLAQVVVATCMRDATAAFAIDLYERVNEDLSR